MNSNELVGATNPPFSCYNFISCESTFKTSHDSSDTKNLNPLLRNPASIQSRMVILETYGYYQDYYSDDAGAGEDLLQEQIENKIAVYQISHPDETKFSGVLDDLALAVLKMDESLAIKKIFELINLNAAEFLKMSLESNYAFLTDWAYEKKMPELNEILKMYAGHGVGEFSGLNCFFKTFEQIKKQGLLDESINIQALDEALGLKFVNPAWHTWNEEDIVNAITKRDSHLAQALNWSEIEIWLKTHDFTPTPNCQLETAYQETIHWVELQIVNESDENKRDLIIDKFINIGHIFLNQKNFHAASQIALALEIASVQVPNLKNKFQEYPELIKFSCMINHEKFLQDLNVFDSEENGPLIQFPPISCAFWVDMKFKYQQMSRKGPFKICGHPEFEKYFCILRNFERIIFPGSGVAEENEMNEYSLGDFPNDTDKALIENLPVKAQCVIWKHYLKYLFTKNTRY